MSFKVGDWVKVLDGVTEPYIGSIVQIIKYQPAALRTSFAITTTTPLNKTDSWVFYPNEVQLLPGYENQQKIKQLLKVNT